MAGKHGSLIHQARQAIGKLYARSHGEKSSKALQSSLRSITGHLKSVYGLQRIENIKPHMVLTYFQARKESGISSSQLSKDATAYRLLADRLGKQSIIPRSNAELGFKRSKSDRMLPKTLDRSVSAEIRAKLVERFEKTGLAEDRVLIAAYDLRSAFGLRAAESLTAYAHGDSLNVTGKGGRFRSIEVKNPEQKAALSQLRSVSKEIGNTEGKLIPPHLSLQQAYDHQRNTIRACNGTKATHSNMHIVRHDYAQREKAAGVSDKLLSEQLGHGREEVVGHYVS